MKIYPYPKNCKSELARRAFRHGFKDAATACAESGEYDAPVDGWDGWAINGIGYAAFRKELGAKTTREFKRACCWYAAGAQYAARRDRDRV